MKKRVEITRWQFRLLFSAISKLAFVDDGMNISGIGSGPSNSAGSGHPFNAAYQAASQRLLKAQGDEGLWSGATGGGVNKAYLVPSRSREEKAARQLLQRRLELGHILHSSVGDDFMRTVFAGRVLLERVPSFLKKVTRGCHLEWGHIISECLLASVAFFMCTRLCDRKVHRK